MAKAWSAWVVEFRSKVGPHDWTRLTPDAPPQSLVACEDEVRAHPSAREAASLLFRFRNVRSGETRNAPLTASD